MNYIEGEINSMLLLLVLPGFSSIYFLILKHYKEVHSAKQMKNGGFDWTLTWFVSGIEGGKFGKNRKMMIYVFTS